MGGRLDTSERRFGVGRDFHGDFHRDHRLRRPLLNPIWEELMIEIEILQSYAIIKINSAGDFLGTWWNLNQILQTN